MAPNRTMETRKAMVMVDVMSKANLLKVRSTPPKRKAPAMAVVIMPLIMLIPMC